MSASFSANEIAAFFEDVHGYPPFPWQQSLARQVLAGDWPDAIDVPTGLGKTWAIDVAVLSMASASLQDERACPRRIFFVVDRRTIVDEAYEHARTLVTKLLQPEHEVTARVAEALRWLTGGEGSPLEAVRMRGGVSWADRWVWRPDQPCVVACTVDQIGSRLLFRGYGVSSRMRPVDAALTGAGALVLLDEAHLAEPFRDTLGAVTREGGLLPGLRIITLSATQDSLGRTLDFDVAAHLEDDEAARRLRASKRLAVIKADAPKLMQRLADAAKAMVKRGDVDRLLVVCNTVATARGVFDRIPDAIDKGLLTGRSRPLEREWVAARWMERFRRGTENEVPTVLVATQTVEVGVNLDADALVTQECALDALIQRLGRVNRFGAHTGYAVVVRTDREDPVYGDAAPATTRLLLGAWGAPELATTADIAGDTARWRDVSPVALRWALAESPPRNDLIPQRGHAPLVDSSLFDWWSHTEPVPSPDPPVAPYLHGLSASQGTVSVAWRRTVADRLDIPLSAQECVDVPIGGFRRWWTDAEDADVTDVEGATDENPSTGGSPAASRATVWRVRGPQEFEKVRLDQLRAGDTVVVAAERGGLDAWGWAPSLTSEVLDIADLPLRRGRRLLRIGLDTLRPLLGAVGVVDEKVLRAIESVGSDLHPDSEIPVNESAARLAGTLVDSLAATARETPYADAFHALASDLTGSSVRLWNARNADTNGWVPVLTVPGRKTTTEADLSAIDDGTTFGSTSTGVTVKLDDHLDAVGRRAEAFAENIGLPTTLVTAAGLAGRWHDLGKLDPRFQRMLTLAAGDLWSEPPEPLAKSGLHPGSRTGRRLQRESGYPPGMRHEALSARLVAGRLAVDGLPHEHGDVDADLVIHLVAAHHGRARPFTGSVTGNSSERIRWSDGNAVTEADPPLAEDLDQPARFERLQRKYGRWSLAMLETIVRLADISCSKDGT
jgi:CRISPR-associated endonuclease/helicase Cas3